MEERIANYLGGAGCRDNLLTLYGLRKIIAGQTSKGVLATVWRPTNQLAQDNLLILSKQNLISDDFVGVLF